MQIVIDIDDSMFKSIKKSNMDNAKVIVRNYHATITTAIKNGTPLPKGHGRLIDADELTKEIKSYISDTSNLHYDDLVEVEAYNSAYCNCLDEIEDAPTIIETDKVDPQGSEEV